MGDAAAGWSRRLGFGRHSRSPWAAGTLDVPDDAGPIAAGDGRTWPTLGEALIELVGEGWRVAGATRETERVRYLLRRLRR